MLLPEVIDAVIVRVGEEKGSRMEEEEKRRMVDRKRRGMAGCGEA